MRRYFGRLRGCAMALGLSLWVVGSCNAAIITFSGSDPGVGPGGARPNSNAAAASFDGAASALNTLNIINFESAPLGNFGALAVAPGVTATLTGTATDANAGITNILGDATLGYNTTVGGSRFLRFVPTFTTGAHNVNFSFADPIQAFGAYLTGLGTAAGNLHVVFNDGSAQDLSVAGNGSGGVQFFGFTDSNALISSVTLELRGVTTGSRDIFSIDDVRFVEASAVPEPASLTLWALGSVGLGLAARRRSRRKA